MSINSSSSPRALIISGETVLQKAVASQLENLQCFVECKDHSESFDEIIDFSTDETERKNIYGQIYFIWIMGNLGLIKEDIFDFKLARKSLLENLKRLKDSNSRCIFIFPYVEKKDNFTKTSELISILRQSGFEKDILVVGDVCVQEDMKNFASGIALKSLYRQYYPIDIKELSREIVKNLFSLSEKKPRALISKRFGKLDTKKLFEKNNLLMPENEFMSDYKKRRIKSKKYLNQNQKELIEGMEHILKNIKSKTIQKEINANKQDTSSEESSSTKLSSLSQEQIFLAEKLNDDKDRILAQTNKNHININELLKNIKFKKKIKKNKRISKDFLHKIKFIFLVFILFLVFIFFSPIIFLKVSERLIVVNDINDLNNDTGSKNRLLISKPLLNVSQNQLNILSRLNILEKIYTDPRERIFLLQKQRNYLQDIISFRQRSDIFLQSILREGVSESTIRDLYLRLNEISEDGAFLTGELEDYNKKFSSERTIDELSANIDDFRKRTFYVGEFLSSSVEIFGFGEEKKYLLVYADDNIVRPNGGKIKEIGIVKMSSGKVDDITIFESKQIDNKMKGYIVAPKTLYDLLDTESWSIEDSNWSTSYDEAAERISLFLQNSVDDDVDGVITINGEFLQDYIQLYLKNLNGNNNSIYSDFANMKDTDILKRFINLLQSMPITNGSLTEFLSDQINEKNLLIEFFDFDVSRLGWNDSYDHRSCQDSCFDDFIKISEFELSGSSDAEVTRMGSLLVSLESGLVKRKYMLTFFNTSDEEYKSYIRLSVPQESGFAPVTMIDSDSQSEKLLNISAEKGRKEAGIIIDVDPGENKSLIFNWEGGLPSEHESYQMRLLKQPGTGTVDTNVKMLYSNKAKTMTKGNDFLTKRESLLYNSTLLTDEIIQLDLNK
ncbi:DUF4012 domain-containing protein [Candidatus Woesebacteria bacterium]|nr:DUF4012 domain-containing protein [Candidatus Woesebacteria bacterium]